MTSDLKNECFINGVRYSCRTCFDPGRIVYSLFDEACNTKTWSDMLKDITQVQTNDDEDLLPGTMCCKCLEKLKSSYNYILQIHTVNKKYSQILASCNDPLQHRNLSEIENVTDYLAIDLPLEQELQEIKLEKEHFVKYDIVLTNNCNQLHEDSETKFENENICIDNKEDVRRTFKQFEDECSPSSNESDYMPLKLLKDEKVSSSSSSKHVKRKRGRKAPDYYEQIEKVQGRFVCLICQKNFSYRKDCGRHIATIHLLKTMYRCEFCGHDFRSKDYYKAHMKRKHSGDLLFGERLYSKPTAAWRHIECKLCNTTFKISKELRQHLKNHSDVDTLHSLDMSSNIVQHLFPNVIDLNFVKKSICSDIRRKDWFKYYTVLNEHSYEMSISDTEAEDLEEETTERDSKYKCDLCAKEFSFKCQVFCHLKEAHGNDAIPLKCDICKLEFISKKMYEQHSQTHCHNEHKVLVCTHCPAKFVWPENLKSHNCAIKMIVTPIEETKARFKCNKCDRKFVLKAKYKKHLETHNEDRAISAKNILRCSLCEYSCKKLKHLREHMPLHADGKTDIDFEGCSYVKHFNCSETIAYGLLQQEIQNAYNKSQISRFYRAIDKYGNELDILDSDSNSEEGDVDDGENLKKKYRCDLCKEMFKKRKLLLEHQQERHNDVMLPYKCKDCTQQYVSNDLLQQHLARDCRNEHRRIAQQCEHCHARFIWPYNFLMHRELQHKNQKYPSALPKDKKFSCPHCDRKFQRKGNLLAHIRIHCPDDIPTFSNPVKSIDYIVPHLLKPHGCKRIKCMVCFSEHNRVRDLRSHLRTHRYAVNFDKRKEIETIDAISSQLYPDESVPLTEDELIKRVGSDIAAKNHLERFYSITSEHGVEVNLDSSETESDSDDNEEERNDNSKRIYKCDLCPQLSFNRKYKIFDHQNKQHKWEEARQICLYCNGRFLSSSILQLHHKNQCKNTEKLHYCRYCPLRFMWESNMKDHMIMVHSQEINSYRRHKCILCHERFSTQKDLKCHLTTHHSADAPLHYCLLCPKTFISSELLNEHLSRHRLTTSDARTVESIIHSTCWPNGEKTIKCKICCQIFDTMVKLNEHFLPKNPQNMCANRNALANYSITNQKGFELHLELDSETEVEDEVEVGRSRDSKKTFYSYNCCICSMSFKRKYEVAQHQRSMHNYETLELKCARCIFRTVSQQVLDYHRATQCFNADKQYECEQCNFKFMWEENLYNHMSGFHTSKDKGKPAKTVKTSNMATKTNNKSDIECSQCQRRFKNKDRYEAHLKKCHTNGLQTTLASNKITNSKDVKQCKKKSEKALLCAFCGASFTSGSNLTVHMRRHTGEKPFKCDLCEMAFPRTSDLQEHRRSHTGERPFKCLYCEKSFSRKCKLNVHSRIHTGERPYQCTYCQKSFIKSDYLKLHLRSHTGEKPYKCDICGESFICGTSLKKHRNTEGHQKSSIDL